VILVHCRPLPETRTRNSSAAWLAECEVDGRRFEAKSRHGAPNELARRLVEAGVPDAPIEIHYDGLAGSMRYRSFHETARWTFVESQSTPLRRGPFREFGEASKGAGTVLPGDRGCVTSATAGSVGGRAGDRPVSDGSAGGPKSTPNPGGTRPRCVTCGREFRPHRPWAIFCSARCRVAAHRRGKLVDGHSGAKPGAGDQDNRLPASASDVGPTPDFTEPAAEAA
jgi:hypothetical protein